MPVNCLLPGLRRNRWRGIALFLAFCVALAAVQPAGLHAQVPASAAFATIDGAASAPAPPLAGRELLAALRRGGYVIYLRHTSTDFGTNDDAMTSYADCSKQRNLTDPGRAEARAIGAALRELQIPIGEILASPYCRTLETGRLVFGEPKASLAVRGGPATPENPERYAELRRMLATPVRGGTNTAIASHGNPYFGVMGPPYLAEGEAAIIEPLGDGRFKLIARVRKDEWLGLLAP